MSTAALFVALAVSLVEPSSASNEFTVRADVDGPVLAISAVFASAYLFRHQLSPAWCAPSCDPTQLNGLDRLVAGRWSPRWARVSDGAVATTFAFSLATMIAGTWHDSVRDFVVIAESVLVANALGNLSTMTTRRPRPFLYGEAAPLEERVDGNAALSLFSGHTAASFAATLATFRTLRVHHPRADGPWIALAVGLTTSSLVGFGRVLAGQHHPTDVLLGALVGTSVGLLVPALHEVRLIPTLSRESAGLSVVRAY